jgi:hypothetical protein
MNARVVGGLLDFALAADDGGVGVHFEEFFGKGLEDVSACAVEYVCVEALTPLGPVSAEVDRITGRSKTCPMAACAMMLFWYRLGSQSLAIW